MNLETQKPQNKLTRFLCQELLYEYISERLPPARKKAVEDFVATCPETQRELESLRRGLTYAASVGTIEVSESLRSGLLGFEPLWKKRLQAWTLWSSQRGWRILPYAFISSLVVLGIYTYKPWQSSVVKEVVLSEEIRTEPKAVNGNSIVSMSEVFGAGANPVAAPQVAKEAGLGPKGLEMSREASAEKKNTPNARKATLTVSDFTADSATLREKILSLEGKPSGGAELERRQNNGDLLFSFSLPESNFGALEEFLKTFGPVQFRSEQSARVMPEGQIRIILTIKDGGSDNKDEAQAP